MNKQDNESVEDRAMIINSKRFGDLEVREERILHFKAGLLGFSELQRFILVDDQEDPSIPFKWLISVDNPEYGFLVTDPGIFFRDYIFELTEEQRLSLDLQSEDEVSVVTVLTIPSDPKMITANLRGPIVVNARTLKGMQLVLENTDYATKHYIFIGATDSSDDAMATEEGVDSEFLVAGESVANESIRES